MCYALQPLKTKCLLNFKVFEHIEYQNKGEQSLWIIGLWSTRTLHVCEEDFLPNHLFIIWLLDGDTSLTMSLTNLLKISWNVENSFTKLNDLCIFPAPL